MFARYRDAERLASLSCASLLVLAVAACSSSGRVPRGHPVVEAAPGQVAKVAPPAQTTREVLASLDPVESTDLDDYRGGFEVAGLNIDIGLIVSSALEQANGEMAQVSTAISYLPDGKALVETTKTTSTPTKASSLADTLQAAIENAKTISTPSETPSLASITQTAVAEAEASLASASKDPTVSVAQAAMDAADTAVESAKGISIDPVGPAVAEAVEATLTAPVETHLAAVGQAAVKPTETSTASTMGTAQAPVGQAVVQSTETSTTSGGQAVIETTVATTPTSTVTREVTSQTLTQQQATELLNSVQVQVSTANSSITQQAMNTIIENSANNAELTQNVELTLNVMNFTNRMQALNSAATAQALMEQVNAFGLGN